MPIAAVYSHRDFEAMCSANNWTDETIDNLKDKAFISIVCSDTSREALGETIYGTRRYHWFENGPENVCNLDFDDVEEDMEWENPENGVTGCYKALTEEQAKSLYDFIEKNIGKDFYIHCSAGVSRSQAVGRFIREFYPEEQYRERKENPCKTPNMKVFSELKRVYYEKNGFGF